MSIVALKLRSADPARLRRFYSQTFGAREIEGGCVLEAERIEIVAAADPRQDVFASNETGFQHFALVVADLQRAYAHLGARADWRPISRTGPELLPPSSGGATAFKFRDPEGHPLELLQFAEGAAPALWRARFEAEPERLFFGVDHTAITIRDSEASVAFWAPLGFVATHRQTNVGHEQARLDGFAEADSAEVEITSLSPPGGARPGVELLGYRRPSTRSREAGDGSTAATATVIAGATLGRLADPDGHRLEFR